MWLRTACILGILLLFAGTLVTAPPRAVNKELPIAKAETVGMSSQRLERVHAFIQDFIDKNQISGAVTLIARKGKIVHYEAQGWRYKEERQPMPKDAIFALASMTKPIVSTALMMLWEEGKFRLDDPISKWLPSYANKMVMVDGKLVKARPVTVRHILTHTSSLTMNPNERVNNTSPENPDLPAAAAAPQQQAPPAGTRPKTLAEAIERAAPIPLLFQPGDRWQYGSSTDFVAILVEKMSGVTIDEFLRKRMFEPLGMNDTHYNIPQDKVGRVAAIYRFPQRTGGQPDPLGTLQLVRKPQYQEPTTYFPGVAGLNGTAADYWRFSQMLLNGGELDGVRLLGRATVDMMFTNHIGSGKTVYVRGEGFGFGLGAAVLTDPAKSADALSIGSWSWGGANGTIFWIDPVEDMIPIMMIQNPTHAVLNIRPLFSVVAEQTIVDSLANQKSRVMGYDTPR